MKKYLIFIFFLLQICWVYSQKKEDLQLVYCEELTPLTPTKFEDWDGSGWVYYNGPFIDGYLQLHSKTFNKSNIDRINKSLGQWAKFGFFDNRCEPDSTRFVKYPVPYSNYCSDHSFTPEELYSIHEKIKNFGDLSSAIQDTLVLTDKYSKIPSIYFGYYIFNRINDSILFLSVQKAYDYRSGTEVVFQRSKFYNLNTGNEIGIYDLINPSKLDDFIFYLYEKADKENKKIMHEFSTYSLSTESGIAVNYGISMFPQIMLNVEYKECLIGFSHGGRGMQINEIKEYMPANSILYSLQKMVEKW